MKKTAIILILTVAILGGLFAAAVQASYTGYGLVASGAPHARVGSTGGIFFIGGGPGSGK